MVLGGYHLSCNAINDTASDAEEAHLHSVDGSAGDLNPFNPDSFGLFWVLCPKKSL